MLDCGGETKQTAVLELNNKALYGISGFHTESSPVYEVSSCLIGSGSEVDIHLIFSTDLVTNFKTNLAILQGEDEVGVFVHAVQNLKNLFFPSSSLSFSRATHVIE